MPDGNRGNTLGPPAFRASRPAAARVASRTISASTRNRFWRARSRFSGSVSMSSGRWAEA